MSTIILYLTLFISSNITNFTQNWAYYSVEPYLNIFGNLFWGIFFGFIGAGIFVSGEGDSRIYLVIAGYLIIIGIIFGIVLPSPVLALFGLILTFIVTNIFYKTFVEAK